MQAIIRRQNILPDEKVKLFQHALLGYIQLHQKLNQPMAIKVETPAGIPAPSPEKTFAMSRETESVKDETNISVPETESAGQRTKIAQEKWGTTAEIDGERAERLYPVQRKGGTGTRRSAPRGFPRRGFGE